MIPAIRSFAGEHDNLVTSDAEREQITHLLRPTGPSGWPVLAVLSQAWQQAQRFWRSPTRAKEQSRPEKFRPHKERQHGGSF